MRSFCDFLQSMLRLPIALAPCLLRVTVIIVFVAPCSAVSAREVRVATFNALAGFGPPGSSDYEASRAVLARINADVVGFQELSKETEANWRSLAAELGYPHALTQTNDAPLSGQTQAYVGFFSRYPIAASGSVRSPLGAEEMVRFPLRVTVEVPNAAKPLVVWTVHHKAGGLITDQFRRAVEAYRVIRDIVSYRAANPAHDQFVVLGDFNDSVFSVAQQELSFSSAPLLPWGYRLGTDVAFPVSYRGFPDSFYVSSGGLHRVPAVQLDGSASTFPTTGRTLDYVYVSIALRDSALGQPRAEVYSSALDANFSGLAKFGSPLPSGTSYAASDHLVVFADIQMEDAVPASFAVTPAGSWSVAGYEQGPFVPSERDFILANNGREPVNWSAESDVAWIELTPSGGALPAQSTVTVRASVVGAKASALGSGRFKATVRFTQTSSQSAVGHAVDLSVLRRPPTTPAPTPVPTPAPSPTPSPSPSPVESPSPTPSPSPLITPSPDPTPSSNPSPTPAPAEVQPQKADAIEWRLPPANYGDPVLAINYKTSSGRTPVFRSSDPKIVSIRGDLMTIRAAGSVTVRAVLPATTEWRGKESSTMLRVAKARQTVKFRPPSNYRSAPGRTFRLSASATSGLPVTKFLSSDPRVISIAGNRATIRGGGRVKLTAFQQGNGNYASARSVRWVSVQRPTKP